jgi:hypothetical protein
VEIVVSDLAIQKLGRAGNLGDFARQQGRGRPIMKSSKATIDVKDTGERWTLLLLAMSVLIGLAMLPA